jgi:hypothetical protein
MLLYILKHKHVKLVPIATHLVGATVTRLSQEIVMLHHLGTAMLEQGSSAVLDLLQAPVLLLDVLVDGPLETVSFSIVQIRGIGHRRTDFATNHLDSIRQHVTIALFVFQAIQPPVITDTAVLEISILGHRIALELLILQHVLMHQDHLIQ